MLVVFVEVTTPVPPTDGVVAVHPDGVVTDTNVVFDGSVSLTVTAVAALGPVLETPILYVRLFPPQIGSGLSLLVMERSAWVGVSVMAVGLTLTWFPLQPL